MKMIKFLHLFLIFFIILFSISCIKKVKENVSEEIPEYPLVIETENNDFETQQNNDPFIRTFENMPPVPQGMYYRGGPNCFSPDGKMLRVYKSEIFDTIWRQVYDAPIMYLYDYENNILAIVDVFEIVFNKDWGGGIDIKYNSERNSFDMIFSIDAHGNYGTGYIDLNTNEFIRELKSIERVE